MLEDLKGGEFFAFAIAPDAISYVDVRTRNAAKRVGLSPRYETRLLVPSPDLS